MNVADSTRVASALEKLGFVSVPTAEQADVIVLNTCVVRQSAEDKAYGRLTSLRPLKEQRPELVINLMGCLVGVKGNAQLEAAFPYVDVFSPPSDPGPLIRHLSRPDGQALESAETARRYAVMDGDLVLPEADRGRLVSAYVPIVFGCSHACTFCIIPYRRGAERSRSVGEIASEIHSLAAQGVREVTLLGQIVDRYGMDIGDGPGLSDLLRVIHDIDGIERIRFLTSHPNWMSDELLETVAELPKVCEHIEVPVQAGSDEVLRRMKRGYAAEDYRRLIDRIRRIGFPSQQTSSWASPARRPSNSRRHGSSWQSSSWTSLTSPATHRGRERSPPGACQMMSATTRRCGASVPWKGFRRRSPQRSTRAIADRPLRSSSKAATAHAGRAGPVQTSWSSSIRRMTSAGDWPKSKSNGLGHGAWSVELARMSPLKPLAPRRLPDGTPALA
jgi:hypothetical protein